MNEVAGTTHRDEAVYPLGLTVSGPVNAHVQFALEEFEKLRGEASVSFLVTGRDQVTVRSCATLGIVAAIDRPVAATV